MPTTRTKNSRQPQPHRAIHSNYFESLLAIMRTDGPRFHRFSPRVKFQLSVYLDLKGGAL